MGGGLFWLAMALFFVLFDWILRLSGEADRRETPKCPQIWLPKYRRAQIISAISVVYYKMMVSTKFYKYEVQGQSRGPPKLGEASVEWVYSFSIKKKTIISYFGLVISLGMIHSSNCSAVR
jgi:hypothetical protein